MTSFLSFFFNDTPTTEIYTLSLHDALPISLVAAPFDRGDDLVELRLVDDRADLGIRVERVAHLAALDPGERSEEHTSELQSRRDLVCRLLLEKKKKRSGNQSQPGSCSPSRS